MSTVQGLTVNYSGSTIWLLLNGVLMKRWLRTLCEFQRTNLRGISIDLLIFVPDIFWLNDCVFKRNGTFGRLAYHAFLNLLRISKAWLPSPMRRFLESEQCKQTFLLGLPWLGTACLISSWLIGKSDKAIYSIQCQQFQKRNHVFFSYSIKNTHSPFQFEYQDQSIIVFFHITRLCLLVDGGWKSFERLSGLSFLDLFGCHTRVRKGRTIHSFSTTLPHTGSAVVTPKHVHKGWLFAGVSTERTVVEPSISVSRIQWIETGFWAKSKCLSRFVSTRHHFGLN